MGEIGVPDPFDDGTADWEGMIDPVQFSGLDWDSLGAQDEDESLFALLDQLEVQQGDPVPAGLVPGV